MAGNPRCDAGSNVAGDTARQPGRPGSAAPDPTEVTPDGTPSAILKYVGDTSSATGAALSNSTCDVNGDGYNDAVVGAWFWDKAPTNNIGAAYVLFGGPDVTGGSLGTPGNVDAVRIDGPNVANAFVGFAVGCVGDVNGDGLDDFGISYYTDQKTYVLFGDTNFTTLSLSSLGDRGFVVSAPVSGGNLGFSLAAVGDLNNDGLDDFAVAAVVADTQGRTNNGRVWVIAGQDDIADVNVDNPVAGQVLFAIDGASSEERVGVMSVIGDVNGDGVDDILLGSYTATPWGTSYAAPGAAYVVWGGQSVDVDLANLGTKGFAIYGSSRQRDRLGISVSGLGDINGDGKADLLIGADGVTNATTGNREGGAAVVFGSAATDTVYTDPTSDTLGVYTCSGSQTLGVCADPAEATARGYWISGDFTNDSAGYSVAGLGDINGDGINDMVIGAYGYDPINPANPPATMSGAGAAYVVFGKTDTATVKLADVTTALGSLGYRVEGLVAGDRMGRQVAPAGDFDGNGYPDVVIGSDFAPRGGSQNGEITILLLGPLGTTAAVTSDVAEGYVGDPITLTATVTTATQLTPATMTTPNLDGGTVTF
ncbi:MAG TPA: integrin alpha, partial [Ilumatobacteraceae bacterium]|nr:integrin alpha [Ilumatobacteraceae bacterium]